MVVAHVKGTGRRWRRQEGRTEDAEMGSVMCRGWWGCGEDVKGGYGDVQGEQDVVVGHEEGTDRRWWWGHGDGQDQLEVIKGTQEGRDRGQIGDGGDHGP